MKINLIQLIFCLVLITAACTNRRGASSDDSAHVISVGTHDSTLDDQPWAMHLIDPRPASGSDGVKLADVNGDGSPDLVSGFEEDGVSRIYINPGPVNARAYWKYVELPSPDVEDAVLMDLDENGSMDVVTASEGATNKIFFHWAPDDAGQYMDHTKWKSQVVPATDGLGAWMFLVPADMDGEHGMDIIVGSKRRAGEKGQDDAWVGWLKCPENPKDVNAWKFFPLTRAGWVMSIEVRDMNNDGRADILLSDRKFSSRTGVRWLENPGRDKPAFYKEWPSYTLGVDDGEPMFFATTDLNGDGHEEIVVPDLYQGLMILEEGHSERSSWERHALSYPAWAGTRGKAVAAGDINLDGQTDIVLSFEEEGKVASIPFETYQADGRYSVIWGTFDGDPFSDAWQFHRVSNLKGRKFDLVTLLDIDEDGDLDVLTNDENEEDTGLGVVWYENPIRP